MNQAAAIAKIREQLREGNIEASLQILIESLEPHRKSLNKLFNRALQAKAQLEKTQADELQGVISFENSKLSYNQITQQVIILVDEWENPKQVSAPLKRKFTPQMILVSLILITLLAIIGITLIRRGNNSSTTLKCPSFDPKSTFNILILPYSDIKNEDLPSPHGQIARRFERIKEDFASKVITGVRKIDQPTLETDREALQAGKTCMAELVIWGEAENLSPTANQTIITTNYQYFTDNGTFAFTKFKLDEENSVSNENRFSNIPTRGNFVDTITSYSAITNEGTLTDVLEHQLRLLFGVAIMQKGDSKTALQILSNTEIKDSTSSLLKDMAVAESHIQLGEPEMAVKAYDRVLEAHPNYWFALNNRALLYYQKGDYRAAIENLDQKIKEDPNNVEALTIRGAVRIKTQQFKEAEEDLKKADNLNEDPDNTYIRKKIDLLNREKKKEEDRRSKAAKVVQSNPKNIAALTDLAEANRNLGNYRAADKTANQILQLDGSNARAIAVKWETANILGQSDREISAIKRKALQLDKTKREAILKKRPALQIILERQ